MIIGTESRNTYCGCDFFPPLLNEEGFSTLSDMSGLREQEKKRTVRDAPFI